MTQRSSSPCLGSAFLASLLAVLLSAAAAQAEEKAAPPAAATAPAAPAAAAPAPPAPKWFEELSLNVLVEGGFQYGLNNPTSGKSTLRVFDAPSNSFSVGTALLVLQKSLAAPGDVGFRADLDFGGLIPSLSVGNGEVTPTNAALRQGFVSWIAPVGSGLRFDLGKFVTLAGYEFIDTFDNINDNASRSLLFGYAIPFTHTGLQLTYVVSPAAKLTLQLVNGWDQALAKSDGKGACAQLALTPNDTLSAFLNACGTQESLTTPSSTSDHFRTLFDVAVTYKATPAFTIGVNGDLGMEKGTSAFKTDDDASWYGAALYLRYDHASGAGVAVRGEFMKDAGGTRLVKPDGSPVASAATTMEEITVTPFIKLGGHLTIRGEVRVDIADTSIFVKRDGSFTSSQPTLSLGGVYVY